MAQHRPKPKLYKRNHLIAIYDMDDQLVGVCDNAKEFSQNWGKSLDIAHSILSRISLGHRKFFNYKGRRYYIYLIKLTKTDIRGLFKHEQKER